MAMEYSKARNLMVAASMEDRPGRDPYWESGYALIFSAWATRRRPQWFFRMKFMSASYKWMIRILFVCGWPGFFSRQTVAVFVHLVGTIVVVSGMLIRLVRIRSGMLDSLGRQMVR